MQKVKILLITIFVLLAVAFTVSCEEDDDCDSEDNFVAEYTDGSGGDADTENLYDQCMSFYLSCFQFNETQSDALCDDMYAIHDPCLQYYYSRYWDCMNSDVVCMFEYSIYIGAELCTLQLWEEAAQSCD